MSALFCSQRCRDAPREEPPAKDFICAHCGAGFTTRWPQACYCSARCRRRAARARNGGDRWTDARRDGYHRRRARRHGAPIGAPVLASEIFERDGWTCWICEKAVDPEAKYPHKLSAALDHVVPLADGGAHDPSNVRLAHWICNRLRAIPGKFPNP